MGILEFGVIFIAAAFILRAAIELPFLAKVREWISDLDKN